MLLKKRVSYLEWHKVFTDEFETPVFQILTDYKEVRSDDNNDIIIQSALQAFYAEGME